MRRALVNYWVDMATGIAFILCAVTGIVFMFPGTVHAAIGAAPTILLIPATWWHSVHDWSGVAMVAGTALHLALHAKWITSMTRKTFGAQTNGTRARVGRPAHVVAATEFERLEHRRESRRRENERRHTRKAFLTGAAAIGGAALLVGLGLAGRDAASGASTKLSEDGWTDSDQGQSSTGTSAASATNGSSGSSAQTSASGTSSATPVVVDQSACVACGRCLQVCPRGVFAWGSSGRAEASSAGACTRCGTCLQVCPAGAITLSA